MVNGRFSSRSVEFKIDTGTDITVISKSTFDTLTIQSLLHPFKIDLFSPGGRLQRAGQFKTAVTHCNKKCKVYNFVIGGDHASNLLDRQAACEMGLVARLEEVDAELFGDLGLYKCEPVKIKLDENAEPSCISASRRIAFSLKPKIKEELKREGRSRHN